MKMEKLFWKRREPKVKQGDLSYNQRKQIVKVLEQVGGTNKRRDIPREAQLPGKRVSSSGKIYWETRKNRSDAAGSNI